MPRIAEADTRTLLACGRDERLSRFARDVQLVTALTGVLNASLEIAEEIPRTKAQLALSLSKKALSVSRVVEHASDSKAFQLANFSAHQTLTSIGLLKLAGMTPPKAFAWITLTMAEKVVAAAGLAQLDKCRVAISSLVVSTGAGTFMCFGSLGIGCMVGAIAVAADAFDVYAQCRS